MQQSTSLPCGGSEAMKGYERLLSGPALWPREVGWAGEGLVSLYMSLELPEGGSVTCLPEGKLNVDSWPHI